MRIHKTVFLGLVFLGLANNCFSQFIVPENGGTINYTQPYFEVPQHNKSGRYVFYIKQLKAHTKNKKVVAKKRTKFRAMQSPITLDFNASYEWYYKTKKWGITLFTSPVYNFNTSNSKLLDTTLQKIVWQKLPPKNAEGIIMLDGLKLAVDMQGKPVYFIPNTEHDYVIRDINLTPQGSITYMDNITNGVIEIDLNGEMIWHYPTSISKQQSTEFYHHEFEKLTNGNYLIAGKKPIKEFERSNLSSSLPGEMLTETIVEINPEGEEVWRFNLLPEIKEQLNVEPPNGSINNSRLGHLNGLAVDSSNNFIYASFKTFNTIFKINKSNNQIVHRYGLKTIHFNDSLISGEYFSQQHCPTLLPNGNLMIFNNGSPETGSGFVELLASNKTTNASELVNSVYFKKHLPLDGYTAQMGSAQLINKKAVLVGMGNKPAFFEIKRNGSNINWIGRTYYNSEWHNGKRIWLPQSNYRVYHYSSLFRYKFLVDTLPNNRGIKLANVGTEADTYEILFIHNDTTVSKQQITLKPNQYAKYSSKAVKQKYIIISKKCKKTVEM